MGKKPVIEIQDVSKSFYLPHERHDTLVEYLTNPLRIFKRKGEMYQVLKNIDLKIYPGDFIGIMGRNGSGKSTLLKIIAGIYAPTTGKVTINGSVAPFLELGVGFNQELSGKENVYLNGIILGMNKKKIKQKYDEIVEFAELERFMEMPLKNYSSGMKVRLAFSIAIMTDAEIYILDEVLSVGDIAFQKKCSGVFAKFKKENKTVILVTHSANAVKELCTRAVFLKDGIMHDFQDVNKVVKAYING